MVADSADPSNGYNVVESVYSDRIKWRESRETWEQIRKCFENNIWSLDEWFETEEKERWRQKDIEDGIAGKTYSNSTWENTH